MNEQPDTAALRAEWYAGMNIMDAKDCIRALCDALDAARAERDEWKANTLAIEALYLKHFTRAEAAEARIAAALARKCTLLNNCVCDDCLNYGRVRRGR